MPEKISLKPLDIRPDHLAIVTAILQRFVPQFAVWAFGSRTQGKAQKHSDLDLCIVSDTPLSFKTLALMKEAFSESNLPWRVDIVVWATLSDDFRRIVERDRIEIQP